MKRLVACTAAFCCVLRAQTNLTFGPSGNVPPPYVAAGAWISTGTGVTGQPFAPITTDGWGNLSAVGALGSFGPIGGQTLTISQGGQSVLVLSVPNNISTGTTANLTACWDGSGNAITCPTPTGSAPYPKMIGIVYMNGGTGGAAVIARLGMAPCVFDNTASLGHYVVLSQTTAGMCRDAGATFPVTAEQQVIGIVSLLGANSVNYVFVMNDVPAFSPGTSNNLTITGAAGLGAVLDVVENPTFTTSVTSPLYTSPSAGNLQVTAAGAGTLSLSTSNTASANSASAQLSSGNVTTSGTSGNVTVDTGSAPGTPATTGQVLIGANNASTISIGRPTAGASPGFFNVLSSNQLNCNNYAHAFFGPVGTVAGDECAAVNITQPDAFGNYIFRIGPAGGGSAVGEMIANSSVFSFHTKESTLPITFGLQTTEVMRVTVAGVGVGTTAPNAVLHVAGTMALKYVPTSATAYTLSLASLPTTTGDNTVFMTSTASRSVTLPTCNSSADSVVFTVKDASGTAGTAPVTLQITSGSGDLIDAGSTTQITSPWGYVKVQCASPGHWYTIP